MAKIFILNNMTRSDGAITRDTRTRAADEANTDGGDGE